MDFPRQSTLLNQNFGLCIDHQDKLIPCYYGPGTNYYRPWRWVNQVSEDYGSTLQNFTDKIQIILDIQNFKPNEISVKVANNEVIIEGKHDEREDDFGFISRSFKRRYLLPNDCLEDSIESSMSSDGILKVTGFKNKTKKSNEITVPIKINACKMDTETVKVKNNLTPKSEDATKLQCQEMNKKCTAIMLKEDHCCLLKPELLGKVIPATEGKVSEDTKNDLDKIKTCSTFTAEQLDQTKDCQQHSEISLTIVENMTTATTSKSISSQVESTTEEEQPTSTDQTKVCQQQKEISSTTMENMTKATTSKSELSQVESTIEEQQASISVDFSGTLSSDPSAKIYEIVCDISAQLKDAAENL